MTRGIERPALRLVETVTVLPAADGLRLLHGVNVLRVRGPVPALRAAVDRLARGVPVAELEELPPKSVLRRMVTRLDRAGWITDSDPAHGRGTAIERQVGYLTLFGSDGPLLQSRITASRVALLGVGGVGAVVAQHLAGAGVGTLWLVDDDRVALHNLNRQFLSRPADVGRRKTEVARRALRDLAPDAELHTVNRRVTAPGDLDLLPADLSLLVLAADTPADIADITWSWARAHRVPMCSAAVGLDTGYWGPLLVPERGHCAPCFETARLAGLREEGLSDGLSGESNSLPPTPYSFGPANTVVSALLAHEALRFLATGHCSVLNRRGHIRFGDATTTFLEGGACTCGAGRPEATAPGTASVPLRTPQATNACAPSER